jgi:hypothetical protein
MAVRDGPVRFLFDNTGDLYHGHGFEMLAVLEVSFCPNTFSCAFATFLSLVHNKQDEESIHEFRARFEGHLHNISWLMVSIPPILQAMLFLQALHPHYKEKIDLFASTQKDISIATIDSIVSDAKFMDELAFFSTIGKPCLITVDPLDDKYPLDHYDSPVDGIDPGLDSPLNAHLSDGMEDPSVSVGVGWRAASESTQVGFSCSFSWMHGWGVLLPRWLPRRLPTSVLGPLACVA